jgi:hypothetical protein
VDPGSEKEFPESIHKVLDSEVKTMWKRQAPLYLVLLALVLSPFLLGAGCGDSDPTGLDGDGDGDGPPPPTAGITFAEQVACAAECMEDYGTVLDVLIHVLKKVDEPLSHSLPPGIWLDTALLEFGSDLHLDTSPGIDGILEGRVREPPANPGACKDGMQQHDVCIFEWDMTVPLTPDDTIAKGTYSAVDMGITGPPLNSTATRYVIVDRNTELFASDDCYVEITGFDMYWHLPLDDNYSFMLNFTVHYSEGTDTSTLNGSVIGSGDPNVTLTFTSGTQTYDCTFNLDTYALSCPSS